MVEVHRSSSESRWRSRLVPASTETKRGSSAKQGGLRLRRRWPTSSASWHLTTSRGIEPRRSEAATRPARPGSGAKNGTGRQSDVDAHTRPVPRAFYQPGRDAKPSRPTHTVLRIRTVRDYPGTRISIQPYSVLNLRHTMQLAPGWRSRTSWAIRTAGMRDAGYELPRTPLPGTWVNSVGWSQGIEGKEDMPTTEVISTVAAVNDVDRLIEQYQLALEEFVKGNPEPVKELFSHRDDVTLANPLARPHADGSRSLRP